MDNYLKEDKLYQLMDQFDATKMGVMYNRACSSRTTASYCPPQSLTA